MAGLFTTGVTGLRASQQQLSVIGENISNVQTVGYRSQRVRFADLVANSTGLPSGGVGSTGLGVRVADVISNMSQGAIERTGNSTDMAINGQGFFILNSNEGQVYTRNGQFTLDNEGYLHDAFERRVQGFPADTSGNLSSALGDMKLHGVTIPATATTSEGIGINLDATTAINGGTWPITNTNDVTLANAEAASDMSHGVTIYDSLGNAHQGIVFYRKTAESATDATWDVHVLVDKNEISGGGGALAADDYVEVTAASGGGLTQLVYGTDGSLTSAANNLFTVDFAGAVTASQAVTLDYGTTTSGTGGTAGSGLDGATQFSAPSSVNTLVQDGTTAGTLVNFALSGDGTITGIFSNGGNQTIGQVALAKFPNDTALQRVGDNAYRQTRESGQATVGEAGTGGRGELTGGAVETSNVDLSRNLVDMVSVQRNFQANARSIGTAAEVLQTLVQLGR